MCTRDRDHLLARSIGPLGLAAQVVPGAEIIVVQQGDGNADRICRDAGVLVRVIRDQGVGVSRARNLAWRAATSPAVAFTDDDCCVPESWLADHLFALGEPGVVATCGAVVGLPRRSGDDPVAMPGRHSWATPPWSVGHSSNLAVDRVTLQTLGGFDERIGPGAPSVRAGEDADLLIRLLAVGDVLSGVGAPVQHLDWRAESDIGATLLDYERGAGVWIGKLLIAHPRRGASLLRARLRLVRDMTSIRQRPRAAAAVLSGAARGMALGLPRGREWSVPARLGSPFPGA